MRLWNDLAEIFRKQETRVRKGVRGVWCVFSGCLVCLPRGIYRYISTYGDVDHPNLAILDAYR